MYLLRLWRCCFLILSFCPSLHILKVLSNVFREMESTWVLSLQIREKRTKASIGFSSRKTSGVTNVAKPLVGESSLAHGRINTFEVERPRAAIATNKVSVSTA